MATQQTQIVLSLLQLKGIGRRRALGAMRALDRVAVPQDASVAHRMAYALPDRDPNQIDDACSRAERVLEQCAEQGIRVLSYFDEDYPLLLRQPQVADPPAVLFVRGACDFFATGKAVAIVGTRQPTRHGTRAAEHLSRVFSEKGFAVVAGLAAGIDSAAHGAAVRSGGITCAVMPCGLDSVVPQANEGLARAIVASGGCLVSEYAPGTPPLRSSFVERDRIQAGLALGTIAVETGSTGGTMHAVRACQAYGRAVGCYLPPAQMRKTLQAAGPVMLVEHEHALPLKNSASIDAYCAALDAVAAGLDAAGEGPGFSSADAGQMSLF